MLFRSWQGSGNRSIANMFIDLGMGVGLTDEQFKAEMMARREKMSLTQTDVVLGCPLCNVAPRFQVQPPPATPAAAATRPPARNQ